MSRNRRSRSSSHFSWAPRARSRARPASPRRPPSPSRAHLGALPLPAVGAPVPAGPPIVRRGSRTPAPLRCGPEGRGGRIPSPRASLPLPGSVRRRPWPAAPVRPARCRSPRFAARPDARRRARRAPAGACVPWPPAVPHRRRQGCPAAGRGYARGPHPPLGRPVPLRHAAPVRGRRDLLCGHVRAGPGARRGRGDGLRVRWRGAASPRTAAEAWRVRARRRARGGLPPDGSRPRPGRTQRCRAVPGRRCGRPRTTPERRRTVPVRRVGRPAGAARRPPVLRPGRSAGRSRESVRRRP